MSWYKEAQQSGFNGSKVVDSQGNPLVVYHGTNQEFQNFDLDQSAMGTIWFTSNKDSIISGESGAVGNNIVKAAYLNMQNPAGWDEYDKYSIGELVGLGFDGIILDDNYVVWDTSQIQIIDQNIFGNNNELV